MLELKTDYQKEKDEQEDQMYAEYKELSANPKNSKTAVMNYLMKKYHVGSTGTYYAIIRRVEERLGHKAINQNINHNERRRDKQEAR